MESKEAKELHDTHHEADGHGAEHHHDPGFWRKYIFSTDHKIIGIQYGMTALHARWFLSDRCHAVVDRLSGTTIASDRDSASCGDGGHDFSCSGS